MGKDQRLAIEKQVLKAEQLFKARQFKKAGKKFYLAGNLLLKLNEFEEAKDCFINGAKIFVEIEKFDTAVELFRQSGEACLYADRFLEANQIYKEALSYVPKLKNEGERSSNLVTFSVLSYLCLFLKGVSKEGLDYIKRIQKKVDKEFFKENPLIKLVSEITISLRDNQIKYVEKIKENIGNYKFREVEIKLVKNVLLLINLKLLIDSTFKLDKETYTTNEFINLTLNFDTSSLPQIFKDSYYQFELRDFNITKISINLSDNLTTTIKPSVPFVIDIGKESRLEFIFKPHFQIDNPIIGPMLLTCELNKNLIFIYETQSLTPKLISPPATLLTSIKNLRPPLIDKTFPLEILIENKSEGEALDIKIDVEFPEKLKIMRGTTKKQIYSLRTNEELKWEINLKPLEAGDYIIKINIKFMDPDQNPIEETKEFPFSINL
jgi:tetratricopeptide (TPR) repeat protein